MELISYLTTYIKSLFRKEEVLDLSLYKLLTIKELIDGNIMDNGNIYTSETYNRSINSIATLERYMFENVITIDNDGNFLLTTSNVENRELYCFKIDIVNEDIKDGIMSISDDYDYNQYIFNNSDIDKVIQILLKVYIEIKEKSPNSLLCSFIESSIINGFKIFYNHNIYSYQINIDKYDKEEIYRLMGVV